VSYFRPHIDAMAAYVPGEQPTDPRVIKLNTNENPYPPSPRVVEALRGFDPERLRRYPPPMADAFRAAAAEVHGVRVEQVLCTNGADELLRMLVAACCGPDRPLAVPWPTYTLYDVLAAVERAPVRRIDWDPAEPLPVEKLAAERAALSVVVSPNAPTGALAPTKTLATLAEELTGVLLIDEAYVDFASANALELAGRCDNVIVARSMSKGYSLAGLRFGYGIASDGLSAGLLKIKDSYNVDAVSIALATAALRDQDYAQACWEKVRVQRQRLRGKLERIGFTVGASEANFLLARLAEPPAQTIYETLKARGILVRYFDQPGLRDALRITVGTPEQNDRLLDELKRIV